MTKFSALRTWMSSNGGCVRLSVMYHVRSPVLMRRFGFSDGLVTYWRSTFGDGLETSSSRSPACTLLKMSSAFELTTNSKRSGRFSRAAFESVDAL
jgi:hypothetical protein